MDWRGLFADLKSPGLQVLRNVTLIEFELFEIDSLVLPDMETQAVVQRKQFCFYYVKKLLHCNESMPIHDVHQYSRLFLSFPDMYCLLAYLPAEYGLLRGHLCVLFTCLLTCRVWTSERSPVRTVYLLTYLQSMDF